MSCTKKNELCVLGKSACYINVNETVDRNFIYYVFSNIDFQNYIIESATGTTIPNVPLKGLREYFFKLPTLSEQRAISSVLSSLDDKIDLLNQQNTTLETMAVTLYRQWFMEEAREDWKVKLLKDVTDIGIGRTPPRKEFQWFSTDSNDVKWISIKDMGSDGIFISNTSEYLTRSAIKLFNIPIIPKYTVVLSFKMTVGRVAITTDEMLSNEAIAHFKFNKYTPFTKEYLFLFLKTFKYDLLGSTSSIVTSINSAMIKEMEIVIPDSQTMNVFKERTEPLFKKINQNQTQIHTLIAIRDTLLPKLISGEVTILY